MSEKQTMLVVGGCRSGKSSFAEQWIASRFKQKIYIATTVVGDDDEMKQRVSHHRKNRCASWQTIEEPIDIAKEIASSTHETQVYLVDCLTLWLTNLLLQDLTDSEIEDKIDELIRAIVHCPVSVVLVANEVGLGIVPDSSLARRFRDLAGWCNQKVGGSCDKVVFMAAGLPMYLK